jgi:hypothetical protein
MPLTLLMNNAPSLTTLNSMKTGFQMITTATAGVRVYRISMETKESNGSLSIKYMTFSVDLTSTALGTPVVLEIPFIASKFVEDSGTTFGVLGFVDVLGSLVYSGDVMPLATFKLFYLISGDQYPLMIDLKATYTVGVFSIRFIYYRTVGSLTFYTGIYGDKALNDEYTSLIPLPTSLDPLVVQTILGITYYFIRVSNTPGIIFVNGLPQQSDITDTYSDVDYVYTETSLGGNLLANQAFSIKVMTRLKTTGDLVLLSGFKNALADPVVVMSVSDTLDGGQLLTLTTTKVGSLDIQLVQA